MRVNTSNRRGFSSFVSILMPLLGLIGANKQAKAQDRATEMARQSALQQEQRAIAAEKKGEQDYNRANQKKPNAQGILAAAQQMGKQGPSGTMLTGPMGASRDNLRLGQSTLLGS